MIRAATITALALTTFTFPGTSFASDACPCFTATEITAACPRPDADHTEVYDTGGDGKSMILKCLATQNYSPGSIMFEAGPGDKDRGAYCGRQSVEVEPYESGGQFPQVSGEEYAACKTVLNGAAEKLELQLVMDQFSKKDILSGSYRDYIDARSTAKSFDDLVPFMASDTVKELQKMPADLQGMIFEMSQEMAGPLKEAKIISESVDDNQAVIVAQYCSPNKNSGLHTTWYVVENGGWKIRKEYDFVGLESCGGDAAQTAGGDAGQTANACDDARWNKGSTRINELLASFPVDQQDNLYNEAVDATMDKLGESFCSQQANECTCNEEAIKYLEAK
ncbi:MAG: hypothetical protein JKY99_06235 [Rhizobiales bacterium]|nr:hypothetical protein [Hyphomicrobiales bacterium]